MSKAIDRIEHLIQLANSATGNEASVAALKACQLIVRHNLTVAAQPKAPAESRRLNPDFERKVKKVLTDTASKVTLKDIVDLFSANK